MQPSPLADIKCLLSLVNLKPVTNSEWPYIVAKHSPATKSYTHRVLSVQLVAMNDPLLSNTTYSTQILNNIFFQFKKQKYNNYFD